MLKGQAKRRMAGALFWLLLAHDAALRGLGVISYGTTQVHNDAYQTRPALSWLLRKRVGRGPCHVGIRAKLPSDHLPRPLYVAAFCGQAKLAPDQRLQHGCVMRIETFCWLLVCTWVMPKVPTWSPCLTLI